MVDIVNRTMNEMNMDPQLLNRYSEQAKLVIPELQGPDMQHNSPEEQLAYIQQIKQQNPLNYDPNYIPMEQEEQQEDMTYENTEQTEEETEQESQMGGAQVNSNGGFMSKLFRLQVPLVVFVLLWILLLPRINIILNRIIYNIFIINNYLFINTIKALFGGLIFYIIYLFL
jgi:hypothetical protein